MGEHKEGEKNKKSEGEKKGDNGDSAAIIFALKLDMHCEGCAKKVRRSIIKNFDGVESVKADWESGKLTVIGNVDPTKVKEVVEKKTKKKVELVSPQLNKASKEGNGGNKKPDEKKSEKKSADKKAEAETADKPKERTVSTVVLKTRVHCEGCAHKIKKIVGKSQGVDDVNVDLQKDTITIKGVMDMKELLPYLNAKLKRTVELAPVPKEDGGASKDSRPKDGGTSDKGKDCPSEKHKDSQSEKAKEGGSEKKGGGEKKEAPKAAAAAGEASSASQENTTRVEVSKMEYGGYPYGYGYSHAYAYEPPQQGDGYVHQVVPYWHAPEHSHPPQMFSDENPNACSVM
uniref:HMA domain-containing protein n=2 Tax=Opuntia streptacantha TaxID=393608 RepID=A0A7C8Z4P5_OPUST